jgi:hypothetical protein
MSSHYLAKPTTPRQRSELNLRLSVMLGCVVGLSDAVAQRVRSREQADVDSPLGLGQTERASR